MILYIQHIRRFIFKLKYTCIPGCFHSFILFFFVFFCILLSYLNCVLINNNLSNSSEYFEGHYELRNV
jgi:hypothetical protein